MEEQTVKRQAVVPNRTLCSSHPFKCLQRCVIRGGGWKGLGDISGRFRLFSFAGPATRRDFRTG